MSAAKATPASDQPKVNLPAPRAPTSPKPAEQSPEVTSLRAAIETSLNLLEHGFAAEAFGALQSALKPGASELDPDRYLRVGEVSTLIADAHKLITTESGDPTVGLEKLAEAEKLWPDKDAPHPATTKTQAAAERIKLEAYWRTKDFQKVYELSWYVIAYSEPRPWRRPVSADPLRPVDAALSSRGEIAASPSLPCEWSYATRSLSWRRQPKRQSFTWLPPSRVIPSLPNAGTVQVTSCPFSNSRACAYWVHNITAQWPIGSSSSSARRRSATKPSSRGNGTELSRSMSRRSTSLWM
jgi:hypothetical protein